MTEIRARYIARPDDESLTSVLTQGQINLLVAAIRGVLEIGYGNVTICIRAGEVLTIDEERKNYAKER